MFTDKDVNTYHIKTYKPNQSICLVELSSQPFCVSVYYLPYLTIVHSLTRLEQLQGIRTHGIWACLAAIM